MAGRTQKQMIIAHTINAEMDNYLGYTKHDPKGHNSSHSRNGKSRKRPLLLTPNCPISQSDMGK